MKKEKLMNKIIITLSILFIYKAISYIPLPFINIDIVNEIKNENIIARLQDMTGLGYTKYTLTSVSLVSYMVSSLFVQTVIQYSSEAKSMSKNSYFQKDIKKGIAQFGVIVSFFSSIISLYLGNKSTGILLNDNWYVYLIIGIIQATTTYIIIKLGDKIDDDGIGDGFSLLISVNVASYIYMFVSKYTNLLLIQNISVTQFMMITLIILGIIFSFSAFNTAACQLPVKRSAHYINASTFDDENSTFAIKLNIAGTMPIIFAFTLSQAIVSAGGLLPINIEYGSIFYFVMTSILLILFSIFYANLTFNSNEAVEYLKLRGMTLVGIRPGTGTKKTLEKVVDQISLIVSLFLCITIIVPSYLLLQIGVDEPIIMSLIIICSTGTSVANKVKNSF